MENALKIQIEKIGKDQYLIPTTLKIIGNTWYGVSQDEKAKEYYEKSLAFELKTIGIWHRDSAQTLALIGNTCNYDIAIVYYEKALNILQRVVGSQHRDIGKIFFSLGHIKQLENEYFKALDFYKNCLNIYIQSYGIYHPDVVDVLIKIAECSMSLLVYLDAIENYNKVISISEYSEELSSHISRGEILNQIGICYESISDKKNALINFIQSAAERHDCLWEQQESILESVENAKRIAKEIGKENELPEWMR
jgi:tetratricopeptide (TPR) repeat protein